MKTSQLLFKAILLLTMVVVFTLICIFLGFRLDADNWQETLLFTVLLGYVLFCQIRLWRRMHEPVNLPDTLLIEGEEVLYELLDVECRCKGFNANPLPIFPGYRYIRCSFQITNKKMNMSSNFFGREKWLPESILPYAQTIYKNKPMIGPWGVVKEVKLGEGKVASLVVLMDKHNGIYEIFTPQAKEIFEKLKELTSNDSSEVK